MASLGRLQTLIKRAIDNGKITPLATGKSIRNVYIRTCNHVRCPVMQEDGTWQDISEARYWGDHWEGEGYSQPYPNESLFDFHTEAYKLLFGRIDYQYSREMPVFPAEQGFSQEELYHAYEIGCHPSSLYAWYKLDEDLRDHYIRLTQDRTESSPYFFSNLSLFSTIVDELGKDRVIRLRRAATFSAIEDGMEIGLSIKEAFALHTYSIAGKDWISSCVGAYGVSNIKEALYFGCSTEGSVRAYCRGGKDKGWARSLRSVRANWEDADVWMSIDPRKIPSDRYQNVESNDILSALLVGVSPKELSKGILNGKQAVQWLYDGCPSLVTWYVQHVLDIDPVMIHKVGYITDKERLAVLEWYATKAETAKMRQLRTHTLRNGMEVRVSMESLVDEVRPEDLINGKSTSVDRVFQSVVNRGRRKLLRFETDESRIAREEKEKEEEKEKLNAVMNDPYPPSGWSLPAGVAQLLSYEEMVEEGNALDHCVGKIRHGHPQRAFEGSCFYFSICSTDGKRSTVQMSANGNVIAHYGKSNTAPSEHHKQIANRIIRSKR